MAAVELPDDRECASCAPRAASEADMNGLMASVSQAELDAIEESENFKKISESELRDILDWISVNGQFREFVCVGKGSSDAPLTVRGTQKLKIKFSYIMIGKSETWATLGWRGRPDFPFASLCFHRFPPSVLLRIQNQLCIFIFLADITLSPSSLPHGSPRGLEDSWVMVNGDDLLASQFVRDNQSGPFSSSASLSYIYGILRGNVVA